MAYDTKPDRLLCSTGTLSSNLNLATPCYRTMHSLLGGEFGQTTYRSSSFQSRISLTIPITEPYLNYLVPNLDKLAWL